jgi:hypothetical protein
VCSTKGHREECERERERDLTRERERDYTLRVCKWLDRPEEEAVPGLGALTVRTEACLLPM